MRQPPVLILPGLGDSRRGHWQDLWRRVLPQATKVQQQEWDEPELADWLANLAQALESRPGALLVGHSLGCALIAHAAFVLADARIGGALMVAPADLELPSPIKASLASFAPMPLAPLPFPSIVAASADDPYVSPRRARRFAEAWGAQFVDLGPVGHVNIASGHGPWPEGLALLDQLRDLSAGSDARAA